MDIKEDLHYFTQKDLIVKYRDFLVLNHSTFTSFKYSDAEEFTAGPFEGTQYGPEETTKFGLDISKNLADNQTYNFEANESISNDSTGIKRESWSMHQADLSQTDFSSSLALYSFSLPSIVVALKLFNFSQSGPQIHFGEMKVKGNTNIISNQKGTAPFSIPKVVPIIAGLAGSVSAFMISGGSTKDIRKGIEGKEINKSSHLVDDTEPSRAGKNQPDTANNDTSTGGGSGAGGGGTASTTGPELLDISKENTNTSKDDPLALDTTKGEETSALKQKFIKGAAAIGVATAFHLIVGDSDKEEILEEDTSNNEEGLPDEIMEEDTTLNEEDFPQGEITEEDNFTEEQGIKTEETFNESEDNSIAEGDLLMDDSLEEASEPQREEPQNDNTQEDTPLPDELSMEAETKSPPPLIDNNETEKEITTIEQEMSKITDITTEEKTKTPIVTNGAESTAPNIDFPELNNENCKLGTPTKIAAGVAAGIAGIAVAGAIHKKTKKQEEADKDEINFTEGEDITYPQEEQTEDTSEQNDWLSETVESELQQPIKPLDELEKQQEAQDQNTKTPQPPKEDK